MMLVILALLALCALSAWRLAEKRPEHRPVAVMLSVGVAGELARWAFEAAVITPLRAELGVSVPWTGWARAAGHLVDAIWLTWPAALVAAALVVFAGRRPWPALAAWAITVLALVTVHPIAGDGSQGRMLGAAQAFAVLVAVGLFVAWRWQGTKPVTPGHAVLAVILTNELIVLLSGWWAGPLERWNVPQLLLLLSLALVILVQGRSLWTTQPSPSSSS